MRFDQVRAGFLTLRFADDGNDGNVRVANPFLDVFGRTQLVVQFFRDEGQHDASKSRAQKTQGEVQGPAWLAGNVGHQSRINDANVGRLRSGGDARFLDLGVERVVQVYFGLHFLLERGVLRHLSDFFGGAFHLGCHQLFTRLGCGIAGLHAN